jgi:hypothetical protein
LTLTVHWENVRITDENVDAVISNIRIRICVVIKCGYYPIFAYEVRVLDVVGM